MKKDHKRILIVKNESLAKSLLKDGVTFGLLFTGIVLSSESAVWSFLTVTMFLAFMVVLSLSYSSVVSTTFRSKKALKSFVENW